MSDRVLAATTIGAFHTEVREYPFPQIPPDAGVLMVEAAGVCGSDWKSYQSDGPVRIMGHENVGHVYRIGSVAARRWGLHEGDRVALELFVVCLTCEQCRSGNYHLCPSRKGHGINMPGGLREYEILEVQYL